MAILFSTYIVQTSFTFLNTGEITSSDLPPIEDLQITVEEKECINVGTVSSCVDDLVVVQSLPGIPALDLVRFKSSYYAASVSSPASYMLCIFQQDNFFPHPLLPVRKQGN